MALTRIAVNRRHEDLADLFRAPTVAWQLVGKLGIAKTEEE
jgi:hypothetical protein